MTCQEAFQIALSAIDSDWIIIGGLLAPVVSVGAVVAFYEWRYRHPIRAFRRLTGGLFK
jgi:hypothetical protein